jgi:hypothetical protein
MKVAIPQSVSSFDMPVVLSVDRWYRGRENNCPYSTHAPTLCTVDTYVIATKCNIQYSFHPKCAAMWCPLNSCSQYFLKWRSRMWPCAEGPIQTLVAVMAMDASHYSLFKLSHATFSTLKVKRMLRWGRWHLSMYLPLVFLWCAFHNVLFMCNTGYLISKEICTKWCATSYIGH